MTTRVSDPKERLFWTLMRRFERAGLEHYHAYTPDLATAAKAHLLSLLSGDACDEKLLAGSALAAPVERILAGARNEEEASTLLIQGIVLESLGQAIYRIAANSQRVSTTSRTLSALGLTASEANSVMVLGLIRERVGTGEPLYATFADVTYDVLSELDPLADPVDQIFAEHFGLRFADIMGEFAADLITACTELGMQRRKVVAHLAGASMGI